MAVNKHISIVCHSAYVQIRQTSSICQYRTVTATRTLVCDFVLSKLDCYNFLVSGCYFYLLSRLQKVQNSAAKLVFKAGKRDHVQPLLQARSSSLVTGPSQNRLQTVNCMLSQLLLRVWLISCLFLWPFTVHTLSTSRQLHPSADTRILRCNKNI